MQITQELLHKLLNYNPSTGVLTWKHRGQEMFPNEGSMGSWNNRCAGKSPQHIDKLGYISTSILDVKFHAHRLAFLHYNGYLPPIVDHKNKVKTDNRACNLRASDKSTNSCNSKIRFDNKSGVKGVGWHKQSKKWRGRIVFKGVEHNFGLFDTLEQASVVVQAKRIELHGEFASEG